MRVLVTGGAGYVGAFTVRRLWSAGYDVRVVDNLSAGARQAIPAVPLDVVDLRSREALRASFAGFRPDAVVHLAGLKSAPDSVEWPREYFEVNVNRVCRLKGSVADLVECLPGFWPGSSYDDGCALWTVKTLCGLILLG